MIQGTLTNDRYVWRGATRGLEVGRIIVLEKRNKANRSAKQMQFRILRTRSKKERTRNNISS